MGWSYDPATGRIDTVWNSSGDVDYATLANSDRVSALQWYNRPLRVESAYESYRDLRTRVTNKRTDTNVIFGQYDYRYDVAGRRKDVVYSGTAFAASHLFKWGYGDAAYNRGELTGADRHLGTDPDSPGARMTPGDYDYVYDHIGNREQYRLDADPPTTYTANNLNQYTATANPAESFSHDADGNLTADGSYGYEWDGENRLTRATRLNPTNGAKKLEFVYDYLGRRVQKKVHTFNPGWVLTSTQTIVYDGWNPVLVISGSTTTKYTWGLDLSGTLHGAGGIGGLLGFWDSNTYGYWYFYDGNGNVVQVMGSLSYQPVAHYEYDPYGNLVYATAGSSLSLAAGGVEGEFSEAQAEPAPGVAADAEGLAGAAPAAVTPSVPNPFRFSTKWCDGEMEYMGGPVVYCYPKRYYGPKWGRWLSRDPIGERGGIALYCYADNSPITKTDSLGEFPLGSPWAARAYCQPRKCVSRLNIFAHGIKGGGHEADDKGRRAGEILAQACDSLCQDAEVVLYVCQAGLSPKNVRRIGSSCAKVKRVWACTGDVSNAPSWWPVQYCYGTWVPNDMY